MTLSLGGGAFAMAGIGVAFLVLVAFLKTASFPLHGWPTEVMKAPRDEILCVLAKHDGVRDLFDNGGLHLFVLEEGQIAVRYRPGLLWVAAGDLRKAA